ncbi:MAG: nucleotidyl transferase AbiEii/AbiGii toxin family protein [Chloroflexi bacterium]|nr:nucleotidyl transferase AbiEii/AbiGii toxin family protein [Chloroflexota bacterium]
MADESSAPLRPLRLRMAETARATAKPQFVMEKDYAVSYLLAGIAVVPALRESLVFKGGTCLRKAYFPGYRFSEGLDCTSRTTWQCEALLHALTAAAADMKARLSAFGPFVLMVAEERHRAQHPRGQCAFRVRVQFPWMRSPDCSLKVEVSAEEPLLAGSVERRLIHEFPGESLEATIPVYRLEEIAVEKLRALLQSRQHLRERGWLRNRPRDVYDLWYLWDQLEVPVEWDTVRRLLRAKAEAYGITFSGPEDFLDEQVLRGVQRDWSAQLANFVPDLPPFDRCVATLHAILEEVFSRP